MMATSGEGGVSAQPPHYQRAAGQPENPFASLIPHQQIVTIPSFTLESGQIILNVSCAYTTRGKLNADRNNALVICHALSGSADVADWWGPLIGPPGRAFDVSRFFVICLNSLGSPYGTASPVNYIDGDSKKGRYGPNFPATTIRDDVNLHKLVLDDLGVQQIASVVGGSMGGMLVLEWAFFGSSYVRSIVPIATSAQHSAWAIAAGENQRETIQSDGKYSDGYYDLSDPPINGLGNARTQALWCYRSHRSFETRFGRNPPDPAKLQRIKNNEHSQHSSNHDASHANGVHQPNASAQPLANGATTSSTPPTATPSLAPPHSTSSAPHPPFTDPQFHGSTPLDPPTAPSPSARTPSKFSVQPYLQYQAKKFVKRFDANCYIAITNKLDTHDISIHSPTTPSIKAALGQIKQPALVLGIESDNLFKLEEQAQIAEGIADSRLREIESVDGHDAFLLEFKQVNDFILEFFNEVLPDLMAAEPASEQGGVAEEGGGEGEAKVETAVNGSTFGEAEVGEITAW